VLKEAVLAVEHMLHASVPFERIETYIEHRHDLHDAAKNALWLLAWAETDRPQRRQAIDELIASLVA
jgi:hypothetical protein